MASNNEGPTRDDFTVGWMCALAIELTSSEGMLDEVYPSFDRVHGDENIYTLGRIGNHKIVIACLPAGSTGTTPAAKSAADMLRSFPNIRFGLMVGIGGGAPVGNDPPGEDIRLGDVVVSTPDGKLGGVIQYVRGKMVQGGKFERTGMLNTSPSVLRNAVNILRAKHESEQSLLSSYVQEMVDRKTGTPRANPAFKDQYEYQGLQHDCLYDGTYEHQESATAPDYYNNKHLILGILLLLFGAMELLLTQSFPFIFVLLALCLVYYTVLKKGHPIPHTPSDPKQLCLYCDRSQLVHREARVTTDPVIHYGTIASADIVMKHAATRDYLRKKHKILCFEMEAAGLMNDFPCLVIRGICDYSDSHKTDRWQRYASATAAAYAKELLGVIPPVEVMKMEVAAEAIGMVLEGIDKIHTKLDPLLSEYDITTRNRILAWLSSSTAELEQSDRFNKHQPGTGQWFLNSEEFSTWLNTPGQTLFCPGIPGAGKSIMASIIVDFLKRNRSQDAVILYIYCTYDQRQQPGPVPKSITSLYDFHQAGKSALTFEEILTALLEVMRDVNVTFLVVDAIDECSDLTRQEFLREVQKLQASTTLSLLTTARPDVESMFNGSIRLEIRAPSSDIECFLDNHLDGLSRHVQQDRELSRGIKQAILETVDGMFLLAILHLDSLKDKRTKNELRRAVQQLPTGAEGLAETYNNACLRINSQKKNDREWAQRLLSFIVHATRPLKSDALRHALATDESSDQIDEDNCPILDEVVGLCAGLAVHNQQTDTIQLVHYTTFDFLRELYWVQSGAAAMAISCTRYLMSNTFSDGSCATDDELRRRTESNHFYLYAAVNWGHHIRASASEESPIVLEFLEKDKCVSACGQALFSALIQGGFIDSLPHELRGIHLAAYFGLEKAITKLLARGHDKDYVDSYGQTPLCWAVHGGYEAAAELLISRGADINLAIGTGMKEGYENNRQFWNADNDDVADAPSTALDWATTIINPGMIRLLVDNGAIPDLCLIGRFSALFWTMLQGNDAVAKLLLEKGANPYCLPEWSLATRVGCQA